MKGGGKGFEMDVCFISGCILESWRQVEEDEEQP